GFGRNQAWRDHFTDNSQLRELPVEYIPGRSCFIASLYLPDRTQFPDQLTNRLQPVRNHPMGANLSATFGYGNRDRLGMDIQTYKAYFRHWRPTPFVCGSAPLDLPLRSVTRAYCDSVVGRSIMTSGRIAAAGQLGSANRYVIVIWLCCTPQRSTVL